MDELLEAIRTTCEGWDFGPDEADLRRIALLAFEAAARECDRSIWAGNASAAIRALSARLGE
jgi:hypothetical protein